MKPQTSNLKPQTSISQYIVLIFCALFALSAKAQEKITVYNWYDYIELSILKDFEQETGITVNYQTFSSSREILQLIAQNTPMDIAVVPHFALQELMENQQLQALNIAQLSRVDNLDPFISSRVNLTGAGGYALPYLWYTAALGFNRSLLSKTLGQDFEEDWSLLFDPEQNSKIKSCGIAIADAPVELYATLLSFKGYPALLEKTPLNRLRRFTRTTLQPIKKSLRYIDSDRYLYDLGKGDLCLAMGWSGGISRATRMNPDVEMVLPKNNDALIMAFDAMVIPQSAQNLTAAHRFIDFLLRPEISARNVMETLYGSPLKDIKPHLSPSLRYNPLLQVTEKNKRHMQLLSTPGKEQQAVIDNLWDEFVQR